MSERTRAEWLIDLADAVNELTEPRTISEIVEVPLIEEVVNGRGRRKAKRTRVRRRHTITLPGLIHELGQAAIPGSGEAGAATGGFESKPSAELEPLSVLREITDDTGRLARRYSIDKPTLTATLHALVSAPHSDAELRDLSRQATRWVRRAKIATGFEPAPITLNQPCPYCTARHALVLTGDMENARCTRCGVDWTPDTIGLLADMLRANETVETLPELRCWMADCTRRGPHDQHQDERGRAWRREARCLDETGHPSRRHAHHHRSLRLNICSPSLALAKCVQHSTSKP
jgi:hypothetical protein